MSVKNRIPLARVCFSGEEEREVLECLRSGWITTGPRVAAFEKAFAEFVGAPDAVAVSSGTAALHLALLTLDLQPGDEVITPSLTWLSVPNLVCFLGARPVFCDVNPRTLCLDIADVERCITPKTRAIVPVHFAGRPAPLNEIHALARRFNFSVIEDACHAIGAEYSGRRIGSHSGLCAFSFHPNKNMTTAEGGMLTGTDVERLKVARLLRFHGVSRDTFQRVGLGNLPHYESLFPGYKYNMTDLAASLGLIQLKKVREFNLEREQIAGKYQLLLADERRIWVAHASASLHAWHLFNICVQDEAGLRERVMQALLDEGIQTGLHYLPVHRMPWFTQNAHRALPETERIGRTIMSLPLFPGMTDEQIERVAKSLLEAINGQTGRNSNV